ncbi:MAG: thioredoxin family protein [Bacillati bacterium ANGP1]|uniref:Thioredoxin family protein n=1 Tax=Candidatus Segetimicrobium genomatis TaxID=2569760 RepID=A0A537LEE4_9BACT|nr:MAG: thioredoxin family protein [Terrabacteria group bacterium ANGP1]TMJ09756.1 MAG: thioredoxin family protein [Terrabacteria group bacterium ANGP1]
MMIPDRLLAFSLVAAVLAVSWAGLAWRSWRFRRRTAADLLVNSRPLVLAFSTPDCVPCKTIQKPALEELQRRYQDRVNIREVDALAQPELAGRFGILTVPSTVVVGATGVVLAINHGAADWEKLAQFLPEEV